MKQNDVKTHYKNPKHDLFIPTFTGDEEMHFKKEVYDSNIIKRGVQFNINVVEGQNHDGCDGFSKRNVGRSIVH